MVVIIEDSFVYLPRQNAYSGSISRALATRERAVAPCVPHSAGMSRSSIVFPGRSRGGNRRWHHDAISQTYALILEG
jgi:hypothetical protein